MDNIEHLLGKVHQGDNLTELKKLPDNCVDSVVCDPPYGLQFMGKHWDYDVPKVDIWREVMRVLKPGGYLLSFFGTRTYHRGVVAIEDAGFEIRDQIGWCYGCLSEDTEILTVKGWERYNKTIVDNPVLCYNIERDSFEFHKPTRDFIYENKHTAYRIQSDKTDQIVSRNHRVLIEQNGKLLFKTAENLAQEQKTNIPFLESLRDLPETIPNIHKGTSVKKSDLLKKVCRQEHWKCEYGEKAGRETVSRLWEDVLPDSSEQKKPKSILLKAMQWKDQGDKLNSPQIRQNRHEVSGDWAIWRKESSMERWRNLFPQTWELCADKIRQMSKRVFTYVPQRRLRYGAPLNNGAKPETLFVADRGYPSYQSQSAGQLPGKSAIIQDQPRAQNTRRTRAIITPIEYKGKVWCVEVPTGAFVARRNGMIFITGNSGFPKSHDISKGIDKQAGAERTPILDADGNQIWTSQKQGKKSMFDGGKERPATYPATYWKGWGTALKPAWEPICVARKPISEDTVAANVLRWGTGGINIDGCRVGTEARHNPSCKTDGGPAQVLTVGRETVGRWPANIIHDGSDEVIAGFPNSKAGVDTGQRGTGGIWTDGDGVPCGPQYGDNGSAARFFYTAKASKWDRNEDCEGMEVKQSCGGGGMNNPECAGAYGSVKAKAHNFHPTVKPTDLMQYLCRLVTPPDGIVLDPYSGSGSTGKAALLECFRFIGYEREAEYCKIANARMAQIKGQLKLF